MAEVLSQQEIDALLNNVKSGVEEQPEPETKREAVLFDFRLPNRISKNQLRTIKNIHEVFAENFASFLVSKLQSVVTINVSGVDQLYYSEYILSVSNPACLFTYDIRNSDIKGILELSPEFALTLVDRLLGGNGLGTKQSNIITPIEQKVLNVVTEKIMIDLKKAWATIEKMDFMIERFEPDIDFAQITSPNESVLLITFEVLIGERSYMMNLCYATFAFDTILAKLSSQKLSALRPTKYQGTTSKEIIANSLFKTELPVSVVFGHSSITVSELMDLHQGDIIKLKSKISDESVVKFGNKILFYGRPGIVNKKKAIKITRKELNLENELR